MSMEQTILEQETIESKKPSIFGMIFSPSEQFERMRVKPVIWLPLILLTIVATVMGVLVVLNTDPATVPGVEMSAEELEMAKMFGVVVGVLGGLIGTPLVFVVMAAILLGVSKIFKSDVTFKKMFSLIIFISFITMIGQILNQLIILAINGDPLITLTSLNSFIGADGALGAVLSAIEVFNIWYYILLAMGLVKVANLSKPTAYTISIIFFLIGVAFAAASGAVQGMTQL